MILLKHPHLIFKHKHHKYDGCLRKTRLIVTFGIENNKQTVLGSGKTQMLKRTVTNLQSHVGNLGPLWPRPLWLTWCHWRVRLFSQGSELMTPPTRARCARDSSRPGWTRRAMSSRPSCALRCRAARIWADPHSPLIALPVKQSNTGHRLPLMCRVTTCGKWDFPYTD